MSSTLRTASSLATGTRIDNLRIDAVLGQGSFSISYLASDSLQGKQFVLKEYCPLQWAERLADGKLQAKDSASDEFHAGLQRFLSEGRVLAGLQHPNIIEVVRCFEARGTAWMLMPYYPGEVLGDLLERQGPLGLAQVQAMLFPLLGALHYLHRNSVIHQDIKPSNIYITTEGQPLLLDFGAALDSEQSRGSAMGSPGYAAPEQHVGAGSIGPWTDIYGLAATLYRAITGRIPPDSQQRLEAVSQGLADPLQALAAQQAAGLPGSFLQAIQAGLQLQPDQRPRNVTAWSKLFADIQPALWADDKTTVQSKSRRSVLTSGRTPSPGVTEYSTEGRAWLPMVLLGVFVIGLVVLVFYLLGGDPGPSPDDETSAVDTGEPSTELVIGSRDPELNRRWLAALEADTIFGYQQFRQDYPNSLHEADAKLHLARLDDALWETLDADG
ncbi:MAG TPA: serine/threonine-protein kinase, partial [Xanthomonadales bacterium]|nr:serine/threonine-protein kinase [Xanthomonadales bacterium]